MSYRVIIKETLMHYYTVDEEIDEETGKKMTKKLAAEIAISDGGNWKLFNNEATVIKVEKVED